MEPLADAIRKGSGLKKRYPRHVESLQSLDGNQSDLPPACKAVEFRKSMGGTSRFENLAYACVHCNLHKGTDMFALDQRGMPVRLFNPREQSWDEHFRIDGAVIQPLTPNGEATVWLLKINDSKRVIERQGLRRIGLYP